MSRNFTHFLAEIEEETVPNWFDETSIILIQKPDKIRKLQSSISHEYSYRILE